MIVDLAHYVCVVVSQLNKRLLVVIFQEVDQALVLEEHALLENLKVSLRFPQVVDLDHKERAGAGAHSQLEPIYFGLHLVHRLALGQFEVFCLTQNLIKLL